MTNDNSQGANPNPNSEQEHTSTLNDPRSRRKFLRATVIGVGGVAGVAGAAGIARACGVTPGSVKHLVGGVQPLSATVPTLTGYFEHTNPGPCTSTYSGTNKDGGTNRYITFYAANLPAGTYTFNVTQTIGAHTGAIQSSGHGTATLQWEYLQKNSSVHVVVKDHVKNPGCPEDSLKNATPYDAYPVSNLKLTKTQDVVFYAHIQDTQSPLASSTTFTGTLTGTVSKTATITVTLS